MPSAEFSAGARAALDKAASIAQEMNHPYIGTEHILLAILRDRKCGACRRFSAMGADPDELRVAAEASIVGRGEPVRQRGVPPVTARTKKIVDMALAMAAEAGETVAGTSHIVEAILSEGESAAAQILFNREITLSGFAAAGENADDGADGDGDRDADGQEDDADGNDAGRDSGDGDGEDEGDGDGDGGGEDQTDPDGRQGGGRAKDSAQKKTPALNAFGRDLTAMARQGKLDPVIGRRNELVRVIQVLCRRTKNNAVLIGEAGVGKTAVVEGLAQAIASGDVPERMAGKRVVSLDMARLVAGTQYRGQFEERLKSVVEETRRAGNVVLFLDEIHTLVGAGGAEGAMDAANILKPALARGELQCVGATTLKEYRQSVEKDAALERRFQSIMVNEPDQEEALEILKGIASRYEEHHNVKYAPDALRAAVELTARYLPGRLLPDKAIDAIDETGARARMKAATRPDSIRELQAKVDDFHRRKNAAIEKQDFENAAVCRDGELEARRELDVALEEWRGRQAENVVEISGDDIAETVASISGVPVQRITESTAGRLLSIERDLNATVIGQERAVGAVARALRRSRAQLQDPDRPIGSFLFLGPTGVGKTLLARNLAVQVYGDPKALISLDMSEYTEKYTASRLLGAPPGYVGYSEGGQLTERVRRRPYSVVLFDEFEKADGDVMNMLLQILDEGRLTDGQGRVIDFRNTIVICTANLGFDFAKSGKGLGFAPKTPESDFSRMEAKLLEEAKRAFRPELLNRFDETIVFKRLSREDVSKILELELSKIRRRLSAKDMTLELSPAAADFLASKGCDEAMGARPLRRAVRRYVEDPLAEKILRGELAPGRVTADAADDGTLSFAQKNPAG